MNAINLLILYFVAVNLISFTMMGIDKKRAQKHVFRIPESTLFVLAARYLWMERLVTSSISRPVVPVAYNSFLLKIPLYAIQKFCISFFFASCAINAMFIVSHPFLSSLYILLLCNRTFSTNPMPMYELTRDVSP